MSSVRQNKARCSECGERRAVGQIWVVDGKPVCRQCLCGDAAPVTLWPIGVVASERKRRQRGFRAGSGQVAEIRLAPGQERFLAGLAEESHLTVLWQLHRQQPIRTVFARGWDGKRVGPFASRTPDRLTPIAVTDVELLKLEGTALTVRGLDAVDGSPVLDIKVSPRSLRGGPSESP